MKLFEEILEALAVGDAMGMPTEFMTQKDIDQVFPTIQGLLDPSYSYTHSELPFASVTDDTEQNLYLIHAYLASKAITVENSSAALSKWVVECDAIAKKYIGPSSLCALKAIEEGADPYFAGKNGTTCGGIMRTPALVLCSGNAGKEALLQNIKNGCIPTHHTSQAIEAAAAYGFALHSAILGKELEEILGAAQTGAAMALDSMEYVACAPSCSCRLQRLLQTVTPQTTPHQLREDLFYFYGTGLESVDIFTAVFATFLLAQKDVFRAICFASGLGGDTDTIAALAGALCTAYAGTHNIPQAITQKVLEENQLDICAVARQLQHIFWQ